MPLNSGTVGNRSVSLRIEYNDEFVFQVWIWLILLEELSDINLVFLDDDSQAD